MRETEHWTDYPPDDPPQEGAWCSKCERWDEDCECEESREPMPDKPRGLDEGWTLAESNKEAHPSCSGCAHLLLRYPAWDMTFSEYGELNGWEVPS